MGKFIILGRRRVEGVIYSLTPFTGLLISGLTLLWIVTGLMYGILAFLGVMGISVGFLGWIIHRSVGAHLQFQETALRLRLTGMIFAFAGFLLMLFLFLNFLGRG